MKERGADGRFAEKPPRGRPFKKGHTKTGGRQKGVPNKITRAVKEFLALLVDDTEVQEAVRARILKGDSVAFFRALEQVVGKPKETAEVHLAGTVNIVTRLQEARKRLAERPLGDGD